MSGNKPETHLLHPEHFITPMLGNSFARSMNAQAELALEQTSADVPGVTAVIRTRNEAHELESLLNDFSQQHADLDTQIVVVDTGSSDGTPDVARSFGATVVNISQDEFSYPRALNLGFERADNPVVFSTVGHAALVTDATVIGGARHFKDEKIGGVFVPPLPANWASRTERWASMGNAESIYKAKQLKKAALGVMGATNAMFSKEVWQDLGGFDEEFASGGEDTELARKMIEAGFGIIREPLVAVHHIHGLKFRNYMRQWKHWLTIVKTPGELNFEELMDRRPDLRSKYIANTDSTVE